MIENGAVFNGSCVMERKQTASFSEPAAETTAYAEPEPAPAEESSESSYGGENEEYES
ncbi:MAG: hypothetical protein A4E61_00797 [Syntrophorhabdus sp. PtaB.Bin184]|nr:MAG: hypothetical protein A4E61_00797 [Syntrophorhabdus sp. PtaB.Bin184]